MTEWKIVYKNAYIGGQLDGLSIQNTLDNVLFGVFYARPWNLRGEFFDVFT